MVRETQKAAADVCVGLLLVFNEKLSQCVDRPSGIQNRHAGIDPMLQLGADTKLIGEIGEKDKPEFLGNGGQDPVIVDVGGGYGGGVTILLKDNGIEPTSFNGATESIEKTRDGSLAAFSA